jgi:hypothetical protein
MHRTGLLRSIFYDQIDYLFAAMTPQNGQCLNAQARKNVCLRAFDSIG